MKQAMRTLLVSALVALAVSGCLPVLVGGLIRDHIESREDCQEVMADPKFVEKMELPEFRAMFRKKCGGKVGEEADTDLPSEHWDGPQRQE